MYVIAHPLLALVGIVDSLLFVYSIIIFAVCVLSFVNPDPHSPVVKILHQLTNPIFVYFRKYIPNFGGFDLSPLAVLLVIIFVRTGILPVFSTFAQGLLN